MYIYKTIFLINGKIYIGQCVRSINSTKWYLGSGTKILDCINSYGRECFRKEILRVCNDQRELDIWEMVYISKFNSNNPLIGYNILSGVQQKEIGFGSAMKIKEVVEKQKLSRKLYFESDRSKEHKAKCSKRLLGNTFALGVPKSAETRKKISDKKMGVFRSKKTKELIRATMIRLRATTNFWDKLLQNSSPSVE